MPQKNTPSGKRNRRSAIIRGYIILALSVMLVYMLDHPIGEIPALGPLLDPVNGCWTSAESVNKDYNASLKLPIKDAASVWYDDQMTPHIKATNDHDLYFLQGYVHASFRLWQMDMQTRAAAGRVSEVAGDKALAFDRKQKRKGMLFAAENSLKAAEANPTTKLMLDAYTEGVNSYINSLKKGDYPLEYKLMGFAPEPWTSFKCILLMKYMADDLSGRTDDIAHSYLRSILPKEQFELLYPDKISGASPVIPAGTVYNKPTLSKPVAPADSMAFPLYAITDFDAPRIEGKGSNNWALSGARTASGVPILCNDPHLALNLPSLWFKVQLMAPGVNVYGASLPGAPGIIIGFNDNISWGLTNNYRDVKDYFEIKPVQGNRNKYWFNGKQVDYTIRAEVINIKGKPSFTDTVRYTLHGPVMYDLSYYERKSLKRPLAVCWMGHRPSNEYNAVYLMNRAQDYTDFVTAIQSFECPAQNMLYADRKGNIALWGQGQYVNKWKDQGRFIMNGWDSATLWKELIPMRENPHAENPAQGYLCSANQCVTDSTYPYWYNGDYSEFRAWRINQVLSGMQKASIQDMFALQNDNYSMLAANVLPLMLQNRIGQPDEYIATMSRWNYRLTAETIAGTAFQVWWHYLCKEIWNEKFKNVPFSTLPLQERTMQLIMSESVPMYCLSCDRTDYKSFFNSLVTRSYTNALDSLGKLKKNNALYWYKAKNTSITHLTKIPAFSFEGVPTGGWGNTVNAMKPGYGPSWRMVVQMGPEIEAYGIYPGGQSGNPGSKYYADYLQYWSEGKYHRLVFLPNKDEQSSNHIKFKWDIKSGS